MNDALDALKLKSLPTRLPFPLPILTKVVLGTMLFGFGAAVGIAWIATSRAEIWEKPAAHGGACHSPASETLIPRTEALPQIPVK